MPKRSTPAKPETPPVSIDAATLRRLAVKASCDPRTIRAVAEGRTVRGLAGERAREALVSEGLLPEANGATK